MVAEWSVARRYSIEYRLVLYLSWWLMQTTEGKLAINSVSLLGMTCWLSTLSVQVYALATKIETLSASLYLT